MNDLMRRRRRQRMRRKSSTPARAGKKVLTKKRGNFTGVCAGLGEFFGIDPVLVRIGFIAGSFFSFGTAAIAYLGLAAFLPQEEAEDLYDGRIFQSHQSSKPRSIEGESFFEEAQIIHDSDSPLSLCWRCDTVSKPTSKFCHKCGAKL